MSQLLGHLEGLKKKEIQQLEKLMRRTVHPDQFVSPALAEELCLLALEMHQPLTLLLDTHGRVYQVFIGSVAALGEENSVRIPRKTEGLCGLRAVSTQLERLEPPSQADLTTLLQYRLDSLVILVARNQPQWSLQFGEHPKACDAVFVSAVQAEPSGQIKTETKGPMTLHQLDKQSFRDFLALLESRQIGWAARGADIAFQERAFLLGLAQPGQEGRHRAEDLLDELSLLAKTAGAQVVGRAIQSRQQADPQYYMGKGKSHALAYEIQQLGANLVIADDELSAVQQRALERILRTRVIDRTELILDIFAQRANSWEGKIQVELAQLQYLLPRLTGRGRTFSQQTATGRGGAIATRGPGETKLELDRRRLRSRIAELEQQAKSLRRHREVLRKTRHENSMPVVALVGYTNAGKSTLMNTLTQAGTLAEDKLFATLDPLVRKLVRPEMSSCLLVDTVGFIQKLPTTLVKAFRATLEEIQSADLILHLVDVSHPDRLIHIEAVQSTLKDLECESHPQWIVFNKIDCVRHPEAEIAIVRNQLDGYPVYAISAKTGDGIPHLLEALKTAF